MPVPTVITDLSTTIASNSPAGSDIPSTLDDYLRAHAGFIAQLAAGTGFASSVGMSSTGTLRLNGATQGNFGYKSSTGSGATATTTFDDVVIDAAGAGGISILTGTANAGAIVFGDSGSATIGRLQYEHASDTMNIWAAGASRVTVSSTGMSVTGKITAVTEGAGSGTTANSNYNNIVIDSEDTAGMTILSGVTSSGGYRFGRSGNNAVGSVNYNHATDTMSLVVGGATAASATSASVAVPIAFTALNINTTGGLSNGSIRSSGGLGFTSGAGGTVTQLTSKSTAVTLNKTSGAITMHNAALAGGAAVSFTLNNNNLSDASVVVVCIRSGCTTGGSYSVIADSVSGAGTCRISVRNLTSGSLSEALVLSFAVFDGSDS